LQLSTRFRNICSCQLCAGIFAGVNCVQEYLRVLNELISDFDELLDKPEFRSEQLPAQLVYISAYDRPRICHMSNVRIKLEHFSLVTGRPARSALFTIRPTNILTLEHLSLEVDGLLGHHAPIPLCFTQRGGITVAFRTIVIIASPNCANGEGEVSLQATWDQREQGSHHTERRDSK
jgi:hypothetical protein